MAAATAGVRTLPFRVAPIAGEALDSWVEVVAARHGVPVSEALARYGLSLQVPISVWIVALTADQLDRIAAVSGIEPQIVAAMTLAQHARRFVDPSADPRVRRLLWVRQTGARMCRPCLGDTEGRWQLVWRLNWSFACLKHRCLLSDVCLRCGRLQRRYLHRSPTIPQSGYCAHRGYPASARHLGPCMARLAAGEVVTLADGHLILQAQRRIDSLLAGRTIRLALYAESRPSAADMLGDIHLIAQWIIAAVSDNALAHQLPPALAGVLTPERSELPPVAGIRRSANPSVQQAAAGIVAALNVLAQSSFSSAVGLLRAFMAEVDSDVCAYRPPIAANKRLTPVARAVHDAAYISVKAQRRTLHRLAQSTARSAVATTASGQRWIR